MNKPKININDRICSISHNDMDGVVCQIILGQVFKNIKYINTSFYKIDDILSRLNFADYDHVILTDMHPENKKNLYLSTKIIMIDHHHSAIDMHDPEKFHYVLTEQCAAIHTKKFIESLYHIKLSNLDNLVYLTNDYDMYYLNNGKSKLMFDLMFNYYKPHMFRKEFFTGRTRFTFDEIKWLKTRRTQYNKIWNDIDVYEFDSFRGCVIYQSDFMNEIADRLINEEGYRAIIIRNPRTGRVSIRHNIEEFHAGDFLKNKGWGGGHKRAAGLFVDDENDFESKTKTIEKYIVNTFDVR